MSSLWLLMNLLQLINVKCSSLICFVKAFGKFVHAAGVTGGHWVLQLGLLVGRATLPLREGTALQAGTIPFFSNM